MKKLQLLFAGAALIAIVACGGNPADKAASELNAAANKLENAIENEVENAVEEAVKAEATDSTMVDSVAEEAPEAEVAE